MERGTTLGAGQRIFSPLVAAFLCCLTWQANPDVLCYAADFPQDIVIHKDAGLATRYAAEEFQRFFEEASGRKLAIVEKAEDLQGHVFIGHSDALSKSDVAIDTSDLGVEDLRIASNGKNIAIVGGGPRGVLYGVYEYIEDVLGVRFLTAEHVHVPKLTAESLKKPINKTFRPPFEYRFCYYRENLRVPAHGVRLRNNAISDDPKYGGRKTAGLVGHTMHIYCSTREFAAEHPEYFAQIDGKRRTAVNFKDESPYGTQPCWTHPAVRMLFVKGVLRQLKKNPGLKSISIGQSDNYYYCRCDRCEELHRREGSPAGALLSLVNEVADAVADDYPDVLIGTYAYQITRRPPKHIRPRPNVLIQFPTIEACQVHPMTDKNCPRGKELVADLEGWSKLTRHLYIWNYNTLFPNYLLPCPNLWNIEPNVRLFQNSGARGAFMQGAGEAHVSEMAELRNYVICQLMWDPSQSGEQLVDEFVRLHYGKAAPAVRRYIDLIHNRQRVFDRHFHPFGSPDKYGSTPEIGRQGLAILEDAHAAAENKAVRSRVEKLMIYPLRAIIYPAVVRLGGKRPVERKFLESMRGDVELFYRLCDKYGADYVGEGQKLPPERKQIREMYAAGMMEISLPTERQDMLP